ncbi:hypothetical protein [Nostoc sp. 2RC]|jgi:hypothetical protein|uniref:hypothetical protein n=1 Tax=Nostoc sp. 2RC TaxID=2485484 RepID=UPI001629046F|nr:hypothetical protein [Nostoc sp. 2RC]MBC1236185.1 hypothetical protein [Nostoc sp. 2RC]MBL1199905.1 hypothetical protein [Nostoc sp. GBBB01]
MATTKTLEREAHIVGSGSDAVVISLPDVYSNIESVVGVKKLTGDKPDGATGSTVSLAKKSGLVVPIRISYIEGTKRRYTTIICALDKVKTAVAELPGKTYNTFKIKTAYFPRRMRLG